MRAFSQINHAHGLYVVQNAECAYVAKEFPKSEAQIRFKGQDYEPSDLLEPPGKTCSGRFFRLPLNRSFTENEKVEK
jgi:hypothetical protein